MGGVPLLLAMATLGVDYGWQPDTAGGVQYIVQIPPDQLDQLQRIGGDISSVVDPSIRGRIHRVVIRVGTGELPHDAGPDAAEDAPAGGPDTVARTHALTPLDATAAADQVPVPIPSLDATPDSLAATDGAGGSRPPGESLMRPAGDPAAMPATAYPPAASETSGFALPSSASATGNRSTAADGIPPFTGPSPGSTEAPADSATVGPRDHSWSDASRLRSGGPSTEPRGPQSTAPQTSFPDPRQSDPRQPDPRQSDPRQSDPRQSDPRLSTPVAERAVDRIGGSGPSPADRWANPAARGPAIGDANALRSDEGTARGGPAGAGPGTGGFGAPPVGYGDDSPGRYPALGSEPQRYPYRNTDYPNAAANDPANYPHAASGWAGNGGASVLTHAQGNPAAGQSAAATNPQSAGAYDGRPPAQYPGAAAYPYGPGSAAPPPTTGIPAIPTPAILAANPGDRASAAASPPASASDLGTPPQPAVDRHPPPTAGPSGWLGDSSGRDLEQDPPLRPSLAFQPVFNGMLLVSLVANAYLLITLSKLLQRYRNIVANMRSAAPHPTTAS